MADASARLLELARTRFPDLTAADERMLSHAAVGTVADFEGPPAEEIDGEWLLPWDVTEWTPEQTVRSDVLRWLCSDSQARSLVDLRGVRIRAALIAERYDLAYATVPFPLEFEACALPNGMDIRGAAIKALSLAGSRCRDLDADHVDLDGDMRLAQGFRAEGVVWLAGAEIGGQLDCGGATLRGPNGDSDDNLEPRAALFGQSITIKGGAFLNKGFRTEGTVWLVGAEIGVQLDCSNATFSNSGGDAIVGQGMTVRGNVFLREGFRADGEVSFSGARISGQLDCSGATFSNPEGDYALAGEAITVNGDVFLRDGFRAKGKVSLSGAEIRGQLDCSSATFSNCGDEALNGQHMRVTGGAYLRQGFRATGEVSLIAAEIGGQLDCSRATFSNPERHALVGQGMKVKGDVFLNEDFWADGRVSLNGAEIGGQLECDGATFDNPEGDALIGESMRVKGDVFLSQDFQAVGDVSLFGAEIGGQLDCSGGAFITSLDLRRATIRTLRDDSNTNWPDDGYLWLDGLNYRSISGVPANSIHRRSWMKNRLDWIRRQPEYAPQPYTQFRSFLRREGHEPEARTVAIARQTDLRKFGSLPLLPWLWNWFLGFTIAHGYAPWRPLILGIPVIILGSFVFGDAHTAGLLIANQDTPDQRFNALMYSLDTFLPIVDFNEQGKWQPSGVGTNGMWVQRFFWFEIALGWIISTLFVLSFTTLVRQD